MSLIVDDSHIIDVVFQTLRSHVDGMTPAERLSFTERVLSLSPTATNYSSPSSNTPAEMSSSPTVGPIVSKTSRRRTKRSKAALRSGNDRTKKPLNAFMAFRSYIAPILGRIPQKSRSPMLSLMWRAEPRKQIFSLLGAAYSKIRDECSDCPSLDRFLDVASSATNIIPSDRYLELTGWKIVDNEGNKTLRAVVTNSNEVIAAYPLHTNASLQDIIKHCFDRGLISTMPSPSSIAHAPIQPAVSFAALPQNHDLMAENPQAVEYASSEVEDPLFAFLDFSNLDSNDYNRTNPSIELVTQDQQKAYQNTPAIAHWHPNISPPILGFDPNLVQDRFDPFTFEFDHLSNM